MFQVYGIQLYCPPGGEYLFIPIIDFIFPIFGNKKSAENKINILCSPTLANGKEEQLLPM